MTYKEYKKFLDKKFIDSTGKILDSDGIKKFRALGNHRTDESLVEEASVCVVLEESFDQQTALRLESLGLNVDTALENELIGTISTAQLVLLKADPDVSEVEVSGE